MIRGSATYLRCRVNALLECRWLQRTLSPFGSIRAAVAHWLASNPYFHAVLASAIGPTTAQNPRAMPRDDARTGPCPRRHAFSASSTNSWLLCKANSRSSSAQSSGRFACPESELRPASALTLIHDVKVSAFMFNSSATDPTLRLLPCKTFDSACSLNFELNRIRLFRLQPAPNSISNSIV